MRGFVVLPGLLALTCLLISSASGQAHQAVLYNFGSSTNDGSSPIGSLAFDSQGNIYGATTNGGSFKSCRSGGGCGVVFELTLSGGRWVETVIYDFTGGNDGGNPISGVVVDTAGNLYGTTIAGGTHGVGTVFELTPPQVPDGAWTETTVWSFAGFENGDGAYPDDLVWDGSGNLFGLASGGKFNGGVIFELSPPVAPSGSWTESILYAFCQSSRPPDCRDGSSPSGLALDGRGNIYGVTADGGDSSCDGYGCGTAFQLTPLVGGSWQFSTIYTFSKEHGGDPSGMSLDSLGNLYGTVYEYGPGCCGGVFQLTKKNGVWRQNLAPFTKPGGSPSGGVFLSGKAAYGVSEGGKFEAGYIFRTSSEKHTTTIYTFCTEAGCPDGQFPSSPLSLQNGSLLGLTEYGGIYNAGVVFSIGP